MATIRDSLTSVLGDKAAKRLAESFGLATVGDLLAHYPRRYAERGQLTSLAELRDGDYATVLAEVASVTNRPMRNRRGSILEVVVTDGVGRLPLTFFGQGRQDWRAKALPPGTRALFSGQVSSFRGKRQLNQPEYEVLGDGAAGARAEEYAAELIPIYRATARIASWRIADSIKIALDVLDWPGDPLPADLRAREHLASHADALRGIHRPADWADVRRSKKRLKW